jgi:uncharacterized RDD family membrane protein YckC
MNENEYAGLWIRVGASLIDSILMAVVIIPILIAIYGLDSFLYENFAQGFIGTLINYVFPALAVIIFWIYKSATPGKMLSNIRIVDATSGGKPTSAQFIRRYIGYYISMLPFFLGIFWVAFDSRKQGWHDKLAGTVVIRNKAEPVSVE